MTIETLLTPVDDALPCGDNLEYDADFLAMEQASAGKAEQQFGDTIIPAEAPDWVQVERLATALMARTKDLRVMMRLTHAWAQLRGLQGYIDGLALMQQAITRYWERLHPQLEIDGEADPFFRINVLADLGDKSALTASMRMLPLFKGPAGDITLRDAVSLLDGSKQECPSYPGGRVRLQDELMSAEQPVVLWVNAAAEHLDAIRTEVTRHLGESALPEMEGVVRLFTTLARASRQADLPPETAPAQETAQPTASPLPSAAASLPGSANWRGAQLQSRDDALLMLGKVKEYFRQHEPSHPAPLLIERVQRMIAMDFMQLIRDLAPDGLHQLETIVGRAENEENN